MRTSQPEKYWWPNGQLFRGPPLNEEEKQRIEERTRRYAPNVQTQKFIEHLGNYLYMVNFGNRKTSFPIDHTKFFEFNKWLRELVYYFKLNKRVVEA